MMAGNGSDPHLVDNSRRRHDITKIFLPADFVLKNQSLRHFIIQGLTQLERVKLFRAGFGRAVTFSPILPA